MVRKQRQRSKPTPAVAPTAQVGDRLRELRKKRRWTLDELAAASYVSRSMLSQIERREANPTLAVAFRIARALGRTLDDLVGSLPNASVIDVVRRDDPSAHFRNDPGCRIRTLSPLHLEKDAEFYEVALAPGAALNGLAHFAGTREFLTVQRSQVRVTAGPDSQVLGPGDSASYPADVDHAIENVGTEEALVFLVDVYRS